MKRRLATCLALALLAVTAACSSTDYPRQVSTLDYRKFQSIRFNAGRVDVISEYQPRGSAPNIDHLMDVSPSQAVNEWARNNLRANGSNGYVQVRIKDASVITRDLPKIGGIQGHFTKQQAEELVANLVVEISGSQPDLRFSGYATANASKLATVPEDATPAQRKAIEQQMLNELMSNFIAQAQSSILSHLSPMIQP